MSHTKTHLSGSVLPAGKSGRSKNPTHLCTVALSGHVIRPHSERYRLIQAAKVSSLNPNKAASIRTSELPSTTRTNV